MLNTIKAQAED